MSVEVKALGSAEIPALLRGEVLYLSVTDVFDFLQITYYRSAGGDTLSAFLDNPNEACRIDRQHAVIVYQKKSTPVGVDDLAEMDGQLYLRSNYFGEAFGLPCTFHLRTLSAVITPAWELQAVRMRRLEEARTGYRRSGELFRPDTTIGKHFRAFHVGTADWSVNTTQQLNGPSYTRIGLGLGGSLAGGDFKAVLTYASTQRFMEKQQYYLWRYANNRNRVVRQVLAGKIAPQSVSSIFDPVVGVQITNAPTYFRKAYGTYNYVAYVQPNWVVELYINNVFVDYLRSDAMGMVQYNVPITYGTTEVSIRYTGPWGEPHEYGRQFVVPFSLLPGRVLEYKVSAGMVEDSMGSFYAQARANYGCTDRLTIGAGVEYLTSVSAVRALPFVNASMQIAPNLILTGEYVQGVRYKGLLHYNTPSGMQMELNYVKYEQEQEAVKYNYREERRATLTMPFQWKKSNLFTRLALNDNNRGSGRYLNGEWMMALSRGNANLNLTNSVFYQMHGQLNLYSVLASSIRLPGRLTFTPKATYDHSAGKFTVLHLGLARACSARLMLQAAYEQRFGYRQPYYRVGFKYDFDFARLVSNVNIQPDGTYFFEAASGSLLYEKNADVARFSRNSTMGRGGLRFRAFLDVNGNGKKDVSEPDVEGLHVRINGSGGQKTEGPSGTVITGLEPYVACEVTLDGAHFENVSWKILKPRQSVLVEPNQVKTIDVAVVPLGEVSGTVYLRNESGQNGTGGIRVIIYEKETVVAHTLTEEDGYFSYLGLKPGKYTIGIDQDQLKRAGMVSDPDKLHFMVKSNKDGDVVKDLEFVVEKAGN